MTPNMRTTRPKRRKWNSDKQRNNSNLKHPRETRSGESSDRPTQALFRCGCERVQNKSTSNPKTEKKMIKSPLKCVKWEKTQQAQQNHFKIMRKANSYYIVITLLWKLFTYLKHEVETGSWLLAPGSAHQAGLDATASISETCPHTNRQTRQDQDQGQNQKKDQNPDHNQDQIGCEVRCTRGGFYSSFLYFKTLLSGHQKLLMTS